MKRLRAENVQDPRQTPLLDAHLTQNSLTQNSLKDHFRVIKRRLPGKENAPEPGEIPALTYGPERVALATAGLLPASKHD